MRIVADVAGRRAVAQVLDSRWILPGVVALLMAGTSARAVARPMWHDELFTFYLSSRTTIDGLWAALAAGTDLNPPLYYLAVEAAATLTGPGAFATRLPSLLGFVVTSIALYVIASRHLSRPFAIVAAIVPSLTGAYVYAYEGRPYGLVLGLSAVALAAWDRRGDDDSSLVAVALCAVMLAAATLTHYYAILVALPLCAGEVARTFTRRRVDWPMLVALMFAVLPLVLLRPLIRAAREFGPAFWSPPAPAELLDVYRQLVEPLSLFVPVSAVAIAVASLWHAPGGGKSTSKPAPRLDLVVGVLGFLALPIAAYALALGVTGAFHPRYVVVAVLGAALLAAWTGSILVQSTRSAAILVAVLFLGFAARQINGAQGLIGAPQDPTADNEAVLAQVPGDRQLVVSHALPFLQMAHYASPGSRRRLTYLTRPPEVVRQLENDTASRALHRLASIAQLDVQEYDSFLRSHPHFYLYGPTSWVTGKLQADGAGLRLVREYDNAVLYAVDLRGNARP